MAERDGKGVVLLDGRLIEYLHVEEARRIVALSEAIAALEVELSSLTPERVLMPQPTRFFVHHYCDTTDGGTVEHGGHRILEIL